jgi:glycerate kinase
MLAAVPHLVAAPDKFRGTATAAQVAEAAGRAATAAGWTADLVPLSDGGEGLLAVVGGSVRTTAVPGPDGRPVDAEWRLLEVPGWPPTAVIEMARAAGLALAGGPAGNDPWAATTAGVGHLVLAAVAAGARRVIVGLGGSATTDGGAGALGVPGLLDAASTVELVVACDVATRFADAAAVFGPQKGADEAMVARLTDRLESVARRYQAEYGIDVTGLPGTGAAGGLAGGLAAVGGTLVPGFDLVAGLVDLPARLARADLVVTGEGRLDAASFVGKVVGGVVRLVDRAGQGTRLVCVVGQVAERGLWPAHGPAGPSALVDLTDRAGPERARRDVGALVEAVVAEELARG